MVFWNLKRIEGLIYKAFSNAKPLDKTVIKFELISKIDNDLLNSIKENNEE